MQGYFIVYDYWTPPPFNFVHEIFNNSFMDKVGHVAALSPYPVLAAELSPLASPSHRIRALRESLEKLGVNTTVPMTCMQWETVVHRKSLHSVHRSVHLNRIRTGYRRTSVLRESEFRFRTPRHD